MAICIPPSLHDQARTSTAGERKVFSLLEKLPENCIVWYELVLQELNYRPDFMVLDAHKGVYVVEVKDWDKNAIKKASPKEFRIQMSSTPRPVTVQNPQHKCQIYLAGAKERLSLISEFVNEKYQLTMPVNYLVAFPNIPSNDFYEMELHKVIDPDHVLFQENVKDANAFSTRLNELIPSLERPITSRQRTVVRNTLRDDIMLPTDANKDGLIPEEDDSVIVVTDENEALPSGTFAIDVEQELIAKTLGEGPRLMRGIAGTGKTLIMLIKARLLASNNEHLEQKQRILVVCWNISLANYMRQAFNNINIPLQDTSTVEIVHFMSWARNIIYKYKGKHALPSTIIENFEHAVTQQLNLVQISEEDRYSTVYIDEVQDFQPEWIYMLFHKFLKGDKPQEKNFIAAGDYAQQIIPNRGVISFREAKVTWSSLGIPMQGRSKVLRKVYRNSVRTWAFAGMFYGNIGADNEDEDGTDNAKIEFSPKPGHDPQLIECATQRDQIKEAVRTISEIASEYSPRNVLVLYRRKVLADGFRIVEKLIKELEKNNISYEWISEDNESKAKFNWTEDSVKISTVHSAKGLDAPVVIVLNAEAFNTVEQNTDEVKLMYVALTRAREYIKVLYTGENEMVLRLKETLEKYNKFQKKIEWFEQQAAKSESM